MKRKLAFLLTTVFALSSLTSTSVLLAQPSAPEWETVPSSSPQPLPDAPQPVSDADSDVTLRGTPIRFLHDQRAIWTSPLHLHSRDLLWLLPLGAASGAAIATDHHTLSSVVSHDASFNNANINASNVVVGGLIAAPVALFGMGEFKHNPHARESGLLGSEAILDGLVVEQGMKLVFWRERPASHNARGDFFQSSAGWDSSFPSSHSVLAWSSAAVLAEEYRSPLVQIGIYSLATGVSLTRVLGQEHFPSDVLIGSAAGWLVGHYVYKAHHRRNLH